ncbi:MAG: 4Fe-4S dicluster domain-containing protein [Gemmatimonadetes bacterium]|nr:4Fe-4S dicluster domain-containing protein [Gemmatimonadota bacterium]
MHLRATAKAGGGSAMMPNCPRCGTALHVGAMRCRQCGAPQQAYELVSAPVVEGELRGRERAPKAMVRADVCVGCGTCVDACPEPGAITMHKKLAVVDDALCKGHGECVAACPVGGILVTTGAAVNRVSVPLVNANFESNLPGLYIVGELGGRGLIKNAVNEGRLAVEHIASTLAPATADERDAVDVLIVGSGPAGLSAGVEAIRSGPKYVMVEQGALSERCGSIRGTSCCWRSRSRCRSTATSGWQIPPRSRCCAHGRASWRAADSRCAPVSAS